MDAGLSNNSSSFPDGGNGQGDEVEAAARPSSGSWGFRSNSFPRTSFSGDSSSAPGKTGPAAWAKSFQSWTSNSKDAQNPQAGAKTGFNLFSNIGFNKQTTVKIPVVEAPLEASGVSEAPAADNGPLNTLRSGFMNTSRSAVKAVQTKARHMVSQNKRRYQEGGFDLDLSYITENIIAMGFPAGDMSSGLFGYFEGFYRNHMEEVIKFLETQHKGKHKVYNLCSERLYDAALFQGKVACFPFDDHNCPPLHMIPEFCRSAYDWLKGDLENVVVVHCKAGMARTGLMISCLLLYLKFFPTSEESIAYYNQKRCIDGKGLVLPSQLRYVKYFESVLRDFNGETPKGRKCILRGIRLHRCPYWIRPAITISDHTGVLFSSKKHPRTKDMMSEDIWFAAPRKGVMVFALPGERCIADLNGDFKVHFTDRQGDFYCWLNTNMVESRQLLQTSDLDGFDKRRLPSPGFQVEVVILDHDAPVPARSRSQPRPPPSGTNVQRPSHAPENSTQDPSVSQSQESDAIQERVNGRDGERDSIFSDSDGEDDKSGTTKDKRVKEKALRRPADADVPGSANLTTSSSFSMSSTLGDGLRNAMDRIGITQTGRPGRQDGGASHLAGEIDSLDQKTPATTRSLDNPDKSSVLQTGADAANPEAVALHQPREAGSEQSVGRTVDTVDVKKSERSPQGNQRDPQVQPQNEGAERFDSPAPASDFSATVAGAADASVFTFGDEDDFESEED